MDHVTELASGARFMARFYQLYIATTHLRLSEFSEPGCIGQLGQMASRSAHPFYPFIQLPHNLYAFHLAGHPLIVLFPLVGRDLGIWEQSIGMSVSVCLFVCLFVCPYVCMSVRERVSWTTRPIFSISCAAVRSSTGGVAIHYVLPVAWMTSHLHM